MIDQKAMHAWTKTYIKNRDIFKKEIVVVEEDNSEWNLVVHLRDDKKRCYLIQEVLHIDEALSKIGTDAVFVVTSNTKKNMQSLLDHWNEVKTFPQLCFVFINPDSTADKQWLVYPYTHHKITEQSALKTGIKALFDSVDEVK